MEKVVYNGQCLANRLKPADARATPRLSPIVTVAHRHSAFRIPHSRSAAM